MNLSRYMQVALALAAIIFLILIVLWASPGGFNMVDPLQLVVSGIFFAALLIGNLIAYFSKSYGKESEHSRAMIKSMKWYDRNSQGVFEGQEPGAGVKLTFNGSISDTRAFEENHKTYKAFFFKRQEGGGGVSMIFSIDDDDVIQHFDVPDSTKMRDPFCGFRPVEVKKYKMPKSFEGKIPVDVKPREEDEPEAGQVDTGKK